MTDFSFLAQYDKLIRVFHLAGVAVALGAVLVTDLVLLWLKLKPKMARTVARISPLLSLQIWLGLLILSVSGILLFLQAPALAEITKFRVKMLFVLVLFVNGVFLNLWVSPRFEKLAGEWEEGTKAVKKFTVIAGIAATISFLAWWGTLFWVKLYTP